MKTILIIYPHWHPCNMAGVHRPRLIGNYLKELGWQPRILTVEAAYFEETPDPDFEKTFSPHFVVTRVKALPVMRPRLIGDIGLRAFFQLYKEAKRIIRTEKIDFVWLPIPSFYNALLGRLLYEKTKIPYGIDYIDPWVRDISNQKNKRAILSQWLAKVLEPIAIKKVSVISGVSTPYYAPAIERNFPEIASQLLEKEKREDGRWMVEGGEEKEREDGRWMIEGGEEKEREDGRWKIEGGEEKEREDGRWMMEGGEEKEREEGRWMVESGEEKERKEGRWMMEGGEEKEREDGNSTLNPLSSPLYPLSYPLPSQPSTLPPLPSLPSTLYLLSSTPTPTAPSPMLPCPTVLIRTIIRLNLKI
jgi:hypothetical protein